MKFQAEIANICYATAKATFCSGYTPDMLHDAREISAQDTLTCDICIIGAGPAGLTLAVELAGSGLDVVVLESGDLTSNPEQDELGQPASGTQYGTVEYITNTHRFGGNANAWNIVSPTSDQSVRFAKFQPADFAVRPGMIHSGWPVSYDEVEAYWERAACLWGLHPEGFDVNRIRSAEDEVLGIGPDFTTSNYKFPNTGKVLAGFRQTILAAGNVRVILHATALHFDSDPGATRATSLRVASKPGFTFSIRAKDYVIACGGMDSCRLLLNSPTAKGHGLGNAQDIVGRYFMDHPMIEGGSFVPKDRRLLERAGLYDITDHGPYITQAYLHPTDEALMGRLSVNLNALILPRPKFWKPGRGLSPRGQRAHTSAVNLRTAFLRRQMPRWQDIRNVVTGIDAVFIKLFGMLVFHDPNIGRGGWSRRRPMPRRYDRFQVILFAEQAPHPDNRLVLSDQTDSLGRPKLTIDWRWHGEDMAAFLDSQKRLTDALDQSGLGYHVPSREDGQLDIVTTSCGHHMGATRMGHDPTTSVVNESCRVHGVDNVFVASSSVFPTGGFANPTFTICALAIRIGDELKRRHAGAVLQATG